MTNDLRTHIAVTLHDATDSLTMTDCQVLADAVIRELKLHVVTVGDFQTVIKGSYPKPLEENDG